MAYCWGWDFNGQLGNGGTSADTQSPSAVNTSAIPGNSAFVHLVAGVIHTCGLTGDGVAYCWGQDGLGQLGDGAAQADAQSPSPVDTSAMAGSRAFVRLTAGWNHTCGLTADGATYCWGSDSNGQLGNGGASLDTHSPSTLDTSGVAGDRTVARLAGGGNHTCGTTVVGGAYCWGSDANGQLGNGGTAFGSQSPLSVDTAVIAGTNTLVGFTAGESHTCGLTAGGVAYCWGSDSRGQLGNGGGALDAQSPAAVSAAVIPGNKAFVSLTAGWSHTCGLTAAGETYCWGSNESGQLGNGGAGTDTQSPSAVAVPPL